MNMESKERTPIKLVSPDSLSPEEKTTLQESLKINLAFTNRKDGLYIQYEGLNPKEIGPFNSKKEMYQFCGLDPDKGEKPAVSEWEHS